MRELDTSTMVFAFHYLTRELFSKVNITLKVIEIHVVTEIDLDFNKKAGFVKAEMVLAKVFGGEG